MLIETYRSRLKKMDALLREHLSLTTYTLPQGGYFFWLHLPERFNAVELRKQAKSLNVDIRPGTLFSCAGGLHNFIRLCFAYYGEEDLERGILRLKQCFENQ
jgi:DNA-binding transcriptional MocR family regulator